MENIYNGLVFKWRDGRSYHLDLDRSMVSSYILTAGSPERIKLLENYLEDVKIREYRGFLTLNGVYKGILVTGFSSGIGPSSTSIALTEILNLLTSYSNIGFIIRMGTGGPIQDYIPGWSLIVANSVVRDESTTRRIIYPEYPAYMDPIIYLSLLKSSYNHGYVMDRNLFLGIIHSKDNLYFYEGFHNSPLKEDNMRRFKAFKDMGILATEMESSILPVLRDYFKARYKREVDREIGLYVGSILLILKNKFEKKVFRENEVKLVEVSLDALKIIDGFMKGEESLDNMLRWVSSGY